MGLRNLSEQNTPDKPASVAGIPHEEAHIQREDEPDASRSPEKRPVEKVPEDVEEPLAVPLMDPPDTPGSSRATTPVVAGGGAGIITEAMVKEEEKLHEKGLEEEKKIEAESKAGFEQELNEQRYKRLQHLLQKSSIYANFLLMKMEQQQEQEEEKQERANKSKVKGGQKVKQKDKVKQEEPDNESTVTGSQESGDKIDGQCSQESQDSGASSSSRGKTRSTRSGKTAASAPPNSGKKEPAKLSKTPKRKRPTDNYSIRDYINQEDLNAKKLKTEEPPIPKPEEVGETENKENIPSKETVDDSFSRIIDGQRVSDKQPISFCGGVLRDYQLAGMEWLTVLYENGVNGILADEMGLGKTIQVIALFSHIIEKGVPGPFLVCAPLSTLPNWMGEFARFSPDLPTILYHGSIDDRRELRRGISKLLGKYKVQPIVVTSYEIVMRDRKYLDRYLWKYVVVDEGHRIKNLNCRLIQELKMYKTANRLLLTGTPLQNNLSELWSMLNFLLPEVFDDLKTFESWFDFSSLSREGGDEAILKEEREKNVISMLHQILSPFLLRRLKTDVDVSIPRKKEILVHAPLTPVQDEYYRETVNRTILDCISKKEEVVPPTPVELTPSGRPKRKNRSKVDYAKMMQDNDEESEEVVLKWAEAFATEGLKSTATPKSNGVKKRENNIRLLNIMMQLRKCCNHPYLLSYPLDPVTQEYRIDEELVTSCGKLLVLERLLPALKRDNHKVLIFSQMTSLLDILQDYCALRKYDFCRLDGSMSFQDRQEQMTRFRTDPDSFLFLLSTRAGGLGINLTTADTVIIYDSDWNPQSDLQAMDRCHRIGQEKPVVVYRLVTAGTIDQRIVERAAAKRKLEKMIIHSGKFKGGAKNLEKDFRSIINPNDLLELLRSQDHSNVVGNSGSNVISDADLELLLDRSDLIRDGSKGKGSPKKQNAVANKSKVFEVLEVEDVPRDILS